MPSLGVCQHHFQLMRYYYQGMWTCLLILKACHFQWRWLIVLNTCTLVYFAFTRRPLPLAVCVRLCSRNWAWAGVFARSAWSAVSTALSASLIVSAEYRLLLDKICKHSLLKWLVGFYGMSTIVRLFRVKVIFLITDLVSNN